MIGKRLMALLLIALGFFFGIMIGLSNDPLDRAIRKAQKINRADLKNKGSLRPGGAYNIFGLFKKNTNLAEELRHNPIKKQQYIASVTNQIHKKEHAIKTLDEVKEFVKLAQKEVFIDNSLQRYLYSLGRIQLQNGMVYQAISNLNRSYQINPYDTSTAQLLADSYLGLYQVLPNGSEKSQAGDKAIRFLKLTLLTSPNSIQALYGLALIYTDQHIYQQALPLFASILDKDPENIDALLGAARIYYEQNNPDQARKIYEQAEALILEAKNKRSFLRKKLTIGNLDQKLITIRKNLEILYMNQNTFRTP